MPESHNTRVPLRSEATLEFITFTSPSMATTASNQHKVRSQAMRHVHQQSRDLRVKGKRPMRTNEIELDISPLLRQSGQDVRNAMGTTDGNETTAAGALIHLEKITPSPLTILGATRMDPFFQSPIRMGLREYELYDHLYDETCIMFRTMRNVGFLNRVRQTAAFRQLLAMSSWHLVHLNQSRPMNEHLEFSLAATQELQEQINDAVNCSTDDAIAAVLVFACCANLLHDSVSLNAHMRGLQLMLNQRGGLHTLDSNTLLRIMLFWVDVNGSFFQDGAPRFPPPDHLLPRSMDSITVILGQPEQVPPVKELLKFTQSTQRVQDMMRTELRHRNLWQDTMFPGLHLSPILGELLALAIPHVDSSETGDVLEVFRISAILYISALRARFGIDTLSAVPHYVEKLYACLFSSSSELPPSLLIWALSIAFTSHRHPDRTNWFGQVLRARSLSMGITNYEGLLTILAETVWDDELLPLQSQSLQSIFVL